MWHCGTVAGCSWTEGRRREAGESEIEVGMGKLAMQGLRFATLEKLSFISGSF